MNDTNTSPTTPERNPLVLGGTGPIHPKSPAGVQREHAVRCITCLAWTWNHCAQCNRHCTHITLEK